MGINEKKITVCSFISNTGSKQYKEACLSSSNSNSRPQLDVAMMWFSEYFFTSRYWPTGEGFACPILSSFEAFQEWQKGQNETFPPKSFVFG